MATLYINEFPGLDGRGIVDVLPMPPIGNSALAIGASPGASVVLSKSTKIIRVQSDAVCSIKVSKGPVAAAPVAAATDMRIPANAPAEYFAVAPGSTVNVVTNT
jgi:hypothetical protein